MCDHRAGDEDCDWCTHPGVLAEHDVNRPRSCLHFAPGACRTSAGGNECLMSCRDGLRKDCATLGVMPATVRNAIQGSSGASRSIIYAITMGNPHDHDPKQRFIGSQVFLVTLCGVTTDRR